MLAGYFAHSGYLDLGAVIATAFVGAVCGDQFFFHVGRNHATRLFERFPRLHDKVLIAVHRAERHQNLVVLSMRFLWGLRIALPLAMGMTRMNGKKFFWLNLTSAAVWAALFDRSAMARANSSPRWLPTCIATSGGSPAAWVWAPPSSSEFDGWALAGRPGCSSIPTRVGHSSGVGPG